MIVFKNKIKWLKTVLVKWVWWEMRGFDERWKDLKTWRKNGEEETVLRFYIRRSLYVTIKDLNWPLKMEWHRSNFGPKFWKGISGNILILKFSLIFVKLKPFNAWILTTLTLQDNRLKFRKLKYLITGAENSRQLSGKSFSSDFKILLLILVFLTATKFRN